MRILQVQHDDAFVDDVPPHPYHTRYFDIFTAIVPEQQSQPCLTEQEQFQNQNPSAAMQNLDSMTSYEDAIIMAIIALRDLQSGSTISSIKNYMRENFIHDLFPYLLDTSQASLDEIYSINNCLFLVAMKSLLNRN